MNQRIKKFCPLSILAISLAANFAHAGVTPSVVWDDFDTDPNARLGSLAFLSSTIVNDPFAQGGSLTLDTMFDSGADTGAVFFNSGIGVEQEATLTYAHLGSEQSVGSMDFVALGAVSFDMDFLMADQAFDVELNMSSGSGEASMVILVPAGMDSTVSFTLGDLMVSPSFDLSDVNEVTFSFNLASSAVASLDFATTEIRLVVPNSGSMALFSIGGIIMTRRRR